MRILNFFALFAAIVITPGAMADVDDEDCGPLTNSFGPFDYRTTDANTLKTVEMYHFNSDVERLTAGMTGPIESDIAYTLRAFPNHHRALASLARLSIREKKIKFKSIPYSVDCFFERARRFQPDDGKVHAIYGYLLSKRGEFELALKEFQIAIDLDANDGNTFYNFGLIQFERRDFVGALENAKKAAALGFPLTGLRRKLEAAGKWRD